MLASARGLLSRCIITLSSCLDSDTLLVKAEWKNFDPVDRVAGIRKVKRQFQKCARKAVASTNMPDCIGRIRKKLQRWRLAGIELTTATRCANMFVALKRLTPPRVVAAVWKTMWNGWTTARRFQETGHKCLFGCGSAHGGDSIEHYAFCAIVKEIGVRFVGLQQTHYSRNLGNFVALGLNHGTVDETTLTKRAVLVYAVYRATNTLRKCPARDVEHVKDMIQQYCREAVRGHGEATKKLEEFMG